MAKDVITRFKLENNGFDSKIKQAAKTLSDLGKSATAAGKDFQEVTKGSVEAARAFGSIQTSSNNAKDRLKELTGAFNEVAKAYNSLTKEQQKSDWAKAMADSLTQLQQRIKDTKSELQGLGNEGGIFSKMGDKLGGAMSVFAGNLMTKATMEVANLGSEMAEMVKQGVEMAKAGEGIRVAFERLGNGQILDGLREATHGTVTDIELMKAAVKFNDFKLPIEELGTMLAFAQQKAKDTGQSVDYMVDSIVTGLGRKSLMILDNLGLSAAEIKDKMAETGDMTKAVGEIIREQMSKAGDYVETAADRAAQANVDLQNKLEELGRKFLPVQEASNQLWTSMKIAILDIVGGPLARLLNGLTEAGRLRNQMNDMAGGNSSSETEKQLNFLRKTSPANRQQRYDKQIGIYTQQENAAWREVNSLKGQRENFRKERLKSGARDDDWTVYADFDKRIAEAERKAKAWQNFRADYIRGAKDLIAPPKVESPKVEPPKTGGSGGGTGGSGGTGGKNVIEETYPEGSMKELQQEFQNLKKAQDLVTSPDDWQKYQQQIDEVTGKMNALKGVVKEVPMATGESGLTPKAVSTYQNMLQESMKGMEYGSVDFTETFANSLDANALSSLLTISMKQGIDLTKEQLADGTTMQDLWNQILSGENIDDSVWQELVTIFNEKIEEAFGEDGAKLKITFDVDDKQIKNLSKTTTEGAQDTQKAWGLAAQSVNNMGNALNAIEDPGAKAAGTVIKAISDIALGFAQASHAADVASSGWGWLAWMAAGTAAMATTISTVHSLTGFAEGGVVEGNTYSGDQIPAMLNAGEVVLTRSQASSLAETLEDNERQGGFGGTPYVTGEQIFLGLNNYLKGAGMGSLVTSNG